jgi:hypothetical protein
LHVLTFSPHFHFETLPLNLWIIAIINIHAGVKAMKTLRTVQTGKERAVGTAKSR